METMNSTRRLVILWSFGYRRGDGPAADCTFDVRRSLRDLAVDEEIRPLDGRDVRVQQVVCQTRGALVLIEHVMDVIVDFPIGLDCMVAIGSSRGRHRSVALVMLVAAQLMLWGFTVEVKHRDVDLPRSGRRVVDV